MGSSMVFRLFVGLWEAAGGGAGRDYDTLQRRACRDLREILSWIMEVEDF